MKRRKALKVRSSGLTWECFEAKLYLADTDATYGYTHPCVVTAWRTQDSFGPAEQRVGFRFQRNLLDENGVHRDSIGGHYADEFTDSSYMDTCKPWGRCYAGKVELPHDVEIPIADHPFSLGRAGKLCVAVARKIARVIEEYNIRHVTHDECAQVVEALQTLDVYVDKQYQTGNGVIPLSTVKGRFAAARARAKAAAA